MGITLDFTNVGDGFPVIPKGKYPAKVDEIELKDGPKGPYFSWVFKLQGGQYHEQKAFLNTSLTPQSLWRLKQILTRIAPEIKVDGTLDLDPSALIGKDCILDITVEKYEGEDRSRVNGVLAPGGVASTGGPAGDLPFLK